MGSSRHMGFSWNGDVYKAFVHYKWVINKENINTCFTVDCDHGCGVILNRLLHEEKLSSADFSLNNNDVDAMTFNYLNKNRKSLLNLISPKEFKSICKKLKE